MASCLLIAVVLAISLNGVSMAATSLGHQTHCLDAFGEKSNDANLEHAHDHAYDDYGVTEQHVQLGHELETCTAHGCPALREDALELEVLINDVFNKLSLPEHPQHALEFADAIKHPPKS